MRRRLAVVAALALAATGVPIAAVASDALHFPFDEVGSVTTARDARVVLEVRSPHHGVEQAAGVAGRALRFDGWSTWLEGREAGALRGGALTIEAWIAVAHYPVETAALVARHELPARGVRVAVNPWGRLVLSVGTAAGPATAMSTTPLPRGRWLHVAASVGPGGGLGLFVDGVRVAEATSPKAFEAAPNAPLVVGRDPAAGHEDGVFPLGVFNGLIDELRLHDRALPPSAIAARAERPGELGAPDLAVPASRFADDHARPRFHAMPAAGWTNEPHGLIHDGERFRLLYQANPNGPFWARIRWGQLTSPDLVHWTQRAPALVPEPGFDQAGIWVGATFFDDQDRLRAAYTGVNGVKAGIGVARAGDAFGLVKAAANPVLADAPQGFKDFRDPFVWREDDGWAMLVGSGTAPPDERGVALLYRSSDLEDWRYAGVLNVGDATTEGIYWEVPVLQPLDDGRHALLVTTVEAKTLARGLFWLGRWNGAAFVPETQRPRTLDVFHRMLSPTLARHPDGRLVAIGIVPGTQRPAVRNARGWVHTFSLPREIRPCERAGLCQRPLAELAELRGERRELQARGLGDEPAPLDLGDVPGDQMELALDIDPGKAEEIVLHLRTTPDRRERSTIRLWPAAGVAGLDLSRASLTEDLGRARFEGRLTPLAEGESLRLRVFVDHSVVDVFVNDTDAFSFRTFPSRPEASGVELEAHGGEATLRAGEAWALAAAPIR